ncbi:MAG: dipeptide epimerase [Hymenobacteraceae bacterium]|nr:dipeptide epimerase [Hymenobacteraceae bacterium]MDX5394929.1 dipeptide epimerase [Hymenobacteraceae bacterium]MDX5510962.1 dipeptide epimerase [Hymenobacteraceae bacterium]
MLTWQLFTKKLQLRYTWKIARNATDFKTNLFVQVGDNVFSGTGEAAPNIRYGETPELLQQQFEQLLQAGLPQVKHLDELDWLLNEQQVSNALRFAVESAWVHYQSRKQGQTVGEFLGIEPPQTVTTCVSLPIMEPEQLPAFLSEYRLHRFPHIKVKVNREQGVALVKQVAQATQAPLWIDANEAWTDPDELLVFMEQLKPYPIVFLEQPMPAALQQEYRYLKPRSPYPLFADESVTSHADFEAIAQQFHGVNMKLMKAGGYRNGLRILEQTRKHGLQTMVGCMVESSLGIWSAMQLCEQVTFADLDGFLIVQDEPFNLVQEQEGVLTAAPTPFTPHERFILK